MRPHGQTIPQKSRFILQVLRIYRLIIVCNLPNSKPKTRAGDVMSPAPQKHMTIPRTAYTRARLRIAARQSAGNRTLAAAAPERQPLPESEPASSPTGGRSPSFVVKALMQAL